MTTLTDINDLFGSSEDDEEVVQDNNNYKYYDKTLDIDEAKHSSKYEYLQTFLPHNSINSNSKKNNEVVNATGSSSTFNLQTPFQSTKDNIVFINPKISFIDNLSSRGGGRGFVANESIAPGTLLLAEKSFLKLPNDTANSNNSKLRPAIQLLQQILCDDNKTIQDISYIIKELKYLHPISYVDIEKDHAEELLKEYQAEIIMLGNEVKKSISSKFQIDKQFYVLHICKIHFNAFPSGIYLNFAMINHSCKPNAVKWVAGSHGNGNHSELRACEEVSKGTEITIGYISKRENIYEERQKQLFKQFRFRCVCELCKPSSENDSTLQTKVEPLLDTIQKNNNNGLTKKIIDDFVGLLNFWEYEKVYKVNLKVLEKLVSERDRYKRLKLELYNYKNDVVIGDILIARANRLLSDKCENILVQGRIPIGSNEHLRLLHILLVSLLMLRESELVYVSNGPHVDAVETISRIAKTLQQFLGLGIKGSNYLINDILYWNNSIEGKLPENTKLFKNVSEASKYLRNCERTCKYIKDLYV